MDRFDHLPLKRLERLEERRKTGYGSATPRNIKKHSSKLKSEVDSAIESNLNRPQIKGIDPELILKIKLSSPIDEDQWRRTDFQILAQEKDNILVVFSSDIELTEFRSRMGIYGNSEQAKKGETTYQSFFDCIENISEIDAEDRIGARLRSCGVTQIDLIDDTTDYVVDIELWDAETNIDRAVRANIVIKNISQNGGAILGQPYIGFEGFLLIRAHIKGLLLKQLLDTPAISLIDLPPEPDLGSRKPPDFPITSFEDVIPPPDDAPLIGIIDSGLSNHPLLDGVIFESFGVPNDIGDADIWGHGTAVGGLAVFGDVEENINERSFSAPFRIISAKVVNDKGRFPDEYSIPEQMNEAIRKFHDLGCKIINISLGDRFKIAYQDGRLSNWAAQLDTLAAELDVLIIVSAGNSCDKKPPWGQNDENITQAYPEYLFNPDNRIIDPATAACVITVGAVAHGNGLANDDENDAAVRAITAKNLPTPITRVGPGANNAIKPEFCDYGGTMVFNGVVQRALSGKDLASAGIISLNSDYPTQLFTSRTGTSLAAPQIAWKAALLFRKFPESSANLIRCLLAISADIPKEGVDLFTRINKKDSSIYCYGYGIPDVEKALSSEERRIIFIADDQELEIDQFALYEIPLPKDFLYTKGKRHIKVSLAFTPPVRATRLEYLGVRMSFRLIRGLDPNGIFEHYKKRPKGQDIPPNGSLCKMIPGYQTRSSSTLQSATFNMKVNPLERYGDTYHLAVFAERRWAGDEVVRQSYAISVELMHEENIQMKQQLLQRVKLPN